MLNRRPVGAELDLIMRSFARPRVYLEMDPAFSRQLPKSLYQLITVHGAPHLISDFRTKMCEWQRHSNEAESLPHFRPAFARVDGTPCGASTGTKTRREDRAKTGRP